MVAVAEFAIARLEEIDEVQDGRCPFRPVRHHFGITTFGVTTMTARAGGDRLINEHEESEPDSGDELYMVISGHATFELDGERRDAPTGTLVFVPRGIRRTAFAGEAGTTVLAIGGGPPGEAYRPTGWELFAPLYSLFETGEYELGADRANALLAEAPASGVLFYNTACFEARAGRLDDALGHLRRAVELAPALAASAREDDDLAGLRARGEFATLVGQPD
jgi:tetratricopeptide (TPR) repeat protein